MKKKWNILLLDSKRNDPNYYICLQIKDALKRNAHVENVHLVSHFNAVSTAKINKCNLLFIYGGENINRKLCKILKDICGVAIVWFTEDPYELNSNIANSDLFDCVFTNDPESVNKYPVKSLYLPLAASKWLHYRPIINVDDGYRYDVSFIGTAWPNRVKFLNRLISEKNDIRYKVALPTNQYLPDFDLPLPDSEVSWRTPNTELSRIANKSKISLILHRDFSGSGEAAKAESPGPRIFENAISGGFLLVDDSLSFNSKLFEPGKEYVPFRNEDECIRLIGYYLDNPDERIKIVHAAQKRALKNHTYDSRVDVIMRELHLSSHAKINAVENIIEHNPRILLVSHNVIAQTPFGGVEVYLDNIVKELKHKYEVYIYVPDVTASYGCSYLLLNDTYEIINKFKYTSRIDESFLSESSRERGFYDLIVKYDFKVIHYHQLIGHIPTLPFISKSLGVKSILSLHDYYYICDSFNLLSDKNEYCNVLDGVIESCDICAYKRKGFLPGEIKKRRAFFERALNCFDIVIANSKTTKNNYENLFPSLTNINVLSIPTVVPRQCSVDVTKKDKLKVAILGNFSFNKGADVLMDVFHAMKNERIEFHVFGRVDERYNLDMPGVFLYKGYKVGSLNERLQEMDLSLHASVWPETFCMTLSEAWNCGLIPIVTDIGALAERVTNGVDGFIVPVNDSGAIVHFIRMLTNDEIRSTIIDDIKLKNDYALDQHINDLVDLYDICNDKTQDYFDDDKVSSSLDFDSLSMPMVDVRIRRAKDCNVITDDLNPLGYVRLLKKSLVTFKQKGGFRKLIFIIRTRGVSRTCRLIFSTIKNARR